MRFRSRRDASREESAQHIGSGDDVELFNLEGIGQLIIRHETRRDGLIQPGPEKGRIRGDHVIQRIHARCIEALLGFCVEAQIQEIERIVLELEVPPVAEGMFFPDREAYINRGRGGIAGSDEGAFLCLGELTPEGARCGDQGGHEVEIQAAERAQQGNAIKEKEGAERFGVTTLETVPHGAGPPP